MRNARTALTPDERAEIRRQRPGMDRHMGMSLAFMTLPMRDCAAQIKVRRIAKRSAA